ncbi:MAG TPA: SAM-dependent chlorinase/fluorinase, partial [Pyrinomonadaceae bacterium]|nr:SAM-dependent chlorinase/fluorinase [Pyrinomonadaceae bacterium]
DARIIDITHEVPPQDVLSGAFTLNAVYQEFPEGTIHVTVVDPGVGSTRRPLILSAGNHFFVGPDNGLFSFVYERERDARIFHLNNEQFFRRPVSATFHGRDVFAPAAAALSHGIAPEELGAEINDDDVVRLSGLKPAPAGERVIEGSIIHIDRFGNCVTNFTHNDLGEDVMGRGVSLKINGREITRFRRFFAEEGETKEELFAIWGSAGFLEIAANRASAAKMLDAHTGQKIIVMSDE